MSRLSQLAVEREQSQSTTSTPESTYRPEGAKFQEMAINTIVARSAKGSEAWAKIGAYATMIHHGADAEQIWQQWNALSFVVIQ